MIIDAHNHVNWLGYGSEKIVENMKLNSIDLTWLLSWEVPLDEVDQEMYMTKFKPGQIGMPFTDILEALSKFPSRFVAGYCPDPRKPESIDLLEMSVENYGVKVCGELKLRIMSDNLDAVRMYRVCARHNLPVVVHIDYPIQLGKGKYPRSDCWYGGGLEPFERAIRLCPEATFVGHGPGFWSHISKDNKYLESYYPEGPVLAGGEVLRILREYPNLYADLSANSAHNALSRDTEFGRDFLIEFQDKLLFAKDDFSDNLSRLLAEFSLPDGAMEKILAGNAKKLLPE